MAVDPGLTVRPLSHGGTAGPREDDRVSSRGVQTQSLKDIGRRPISRPNGHSLQHGQPQPKDLDVGKDARWVSLLVRHIN